ncbi:NusA-like transcription termination signal-binding factor [Candidatus Woesearchaeota archaeon]|nr:NusA-like transcription termination signal-binding factor [Candidatus Woesearchaeota archaeon]
MKLKYDITLMGYRTIFENITRVSVKDCFLKDNLFIVIVKENEIGKAIGKGGSNIKELEKRFNKKIKIVEFNKDIIKFTQNIINPIKASNIVLDNKIITISLSGMKEKGQVIGRDSRNLNELKDIISLYFDVDAIKIV